MKQISKSQEWTLTSLSDIHSLKLVDKEEGQDILWMTTDQLYELKEFLNSVDLPKVDKSLDI